MDDRDKQLGVLIVSDEKNTHLLSLADKLMNLNLISVDSKNFIVDSLNSLEYLKDSLKRRIDEGPERNKIC